MGTPNLFPQFLKSGGTGGGGTFVRINLDEIDFELEAETIAALESVEVSATIQAEVAAQLEAGEIAGAVETETTADLENEFSGEVDC
jgi:hypothetical protein